MSLMVLGTGTAACTLGDGGAAKSCAESINADLTCCSNLHQPLSVTELMAAGATNLGQLIETEGMAQWYTSDNDPWGCSCYDSQCSCPQYLGLSAYSCPQVLPLTGNYQGTPVGCNTGGCWPLTPLMNYRLCGSITNPLPGNLSQIALEVEQVCPLP